MTSLVRFARNEAESLMSPAGQLDAALLIGIMADKLESFLGDLEVATRIWLPGRQGKSYILKRGSKDEPLTAAEIARAVTPEFLALRKEEERLSRAEDGLSDVQKRVWHYIVPRKYVNFFYATNGEHAGESIKRVFFDLDRGKHITAEQARAATSLLLELIAEDDDLADLASIDSDPFVYWTGNSFHVMLLLDQPQPTSFYDDHFRYRQSDPEASFTGRWAAALDDQLDFSVTGGHEKKADQLTVDPSQTPSGKLCRTPLGCLHMADASTVDGVSVPVTKRILGRSNLVKHLASLTPEDVIDDIDTYYLRLPERFR